MGSVRRFGSVFLAWICFTATAAADITPLTAAFLANQTIAGPAPEPEVAMAPDGTSLVTWEGDLSSPSTTILRARIFRPDGAPVGDEFQVTVAAALHERAAVAAGTDRFVVVWANGSYQDLRAQRYALDGTPLGAVVIAPRPAGLVAVAMDPDGGFVATWFEDATGFRARRVSASGQLVGSELAIAPLPDGYGEFDGFFPYEKSWVARGDDGTYVAGWGLMRYLWTLPHPTPTGSAYAILTKVFDVNAPAPGSPHKVSEGVGGPVGIAIAPQSTGGFLMAWGVGTFDGSAWVSTRRLDAEGVPLDVERRVSDPSEIAIFPKLARSPGGFVLAYHDAGPNGDNGHDDHVDARQVDAAGNAGPPIPVSDLEMDAFSMAGSPSGPFLVASEKVYSGDDDVHARLWRATSCTDADGDGYFVEGDSCGPADCNDGNASVHPGATEIPGNGLDDDCNPLTPGACQPQLASATGVAASTGSSGVPTDLIVLAATLFGMRSASRRTRT